MRSLKQSISLGLLILACWVSCEALELAPEINHWNGEEYACKSDPQYRWALKILKKLQMRGDEKVLDVGCGDGKVTALIAQAVPNGCVVGVDFSESMLQHAAKVQKVTKLDNLFFEKKDARDLDYTGEFDLAVSFCCLHWVPDHLATLKGIEKSLKPGGRVFLYFAPDHGRARFDSSIKSVVSSSKWASYFTVFPNPFFLPTPAEFLATTEAANFLLKRAEIITIDEVFRSKEAFKAWMIGWMPYLKQLPHHLHQEFLNDIVEKHLEALPMDPDGTIHYIDYFMEVEVLKKK